MLKWSRLSKFGPSAVTRDIYGDFLLVRRSKIQDARGVVGRASEPSICHVKRHGFDARSHLILFIGAGYPAQHQFALLSVCPVHRLKFPAEYSKTFVRTLKGIQVF